MIGFLDTLISRYDWLKTTLALFDWLRAPSSSYQFENPSKVILEIYLGHFQFTFHNLNFVHTRQNKNHGIVFYRAKFPQTLIQIEAVTHPLLGQWERINEFFNQSAREFISSIWILVSEILSRTTARVPRSTGSSKFAR